jgi:8-oxo-dGTP pyrophosphatase MutT (NUDIX family)
VGTEEEISRKPGAKPAPRVQYGALPYRVTTDGALEILLITTRRTKRWVIPKGWPIKGLTPPQSAAREAYEEAGVRGAIGTQAIGCFTYDKALDANAGCTPCEVKVFPLLVKGQSITWPEAAARDTHWFAIADAARQVEEPGLRALIDHFGQAAA